MKVKVTNIGGGLKRLELEPLCSCESFVPTHVVDNIMRDVIHRENRVAIPTPTVRRFERPFVPQKPCACTSTRRQIENAWRDTPNEPHGIDIHVDRPLRENFWSHRDWADAMAKYRTLEDVAKDCDWPCKEPMKGTSVEHWGRPQRPIFATSAPRCTTSFVEPEWNIPVFDSEDDLDWMWNDEWNW